MEAWDQPSSRSRSCRSPPPSALSAPRDLPLGAWPTGEDTPCPMGMLDLPFPVSRPSSEDGWCRNLDRLSIAYALRLRLRSRLTLRRLTFRRNPWAFGAPGFHRGWRYSFRDSHSPALHRTLQCDFSARGTLPYHPPSPKGDNESAASAADLAPLHFRHRLPRPVSYYALFEGWLLLSQPPGCLGNPTSFSTESALRGLSRRSGLFPSRRWSFSPTVSLLAM